MILCDELVMNFFSSKIQHKIFSDKIKENLNIKLIPPLLIV